MTERLLFEFAEIYLKTSEYKAFKALVQSHETFEALQASEQYNDFQKTVQNLQSSDFKRLIDVRLVDEDPEINLEEIIQTKLGALQAAEPTKGNLTP